MKRYFLIKIICLIEVSPEFMQGKKTKPRLLIYVILAVCVNS